MRIPQFALWPHTHPSLAPMRHPWLGQEYGKTGEGGGKLTGFEAVPAGQGKEGGPRAPSLPPSLLRGPHSLGGGGGCCSRTNQPTNQPTNQ